MKLLEERVEGVVGGFEGRFKSENREMNEYLVNVQQEFTSILRKVK